MRRQYSHTVLPGTLRNQRRASSYIQLAGIPTPIFNDEDNQENRSEFAHSPRFNHVLPVIDPHEPLPRITAETAFKLITLEIPVDFKEVIFIDCRFQYEFEKGHIKGAKNLQKMPFLLSLFENYKYKNVCFIFHCEHSKVRGPTWMQIFRHHDRVECKARYPDLFYPHVYLLDGGFDVFNEKYPDLCYGEYRKMDDDESEGMQMLKDCFSEFREETSSYFTRNNIYSRPSTPTHHHRGIMATGSYENIAVSLSQPSPQ